MEIKNKLLKVVALILFFVALFAGFFAYAVYKENISLAANAVELNEKIATLENEVESYKTKLKTISDILNTALDTEVGENMQEDDKKEITELSGTYDIVYPEGVNGGGRSYIFEKNNKVTYSDLHSYEGTYSIEENKVKITYVKGTDPENNPMEISEEEKNEELVIIDEKTLDSNGTKFEKVEE